MVNVLKFLFLGDIIGNPGLEMFYRWVPVLKDKYNIDAVIVNGENAAKDGKGITKKIIAKLKEFGANVITSGNHIWHNKEIYECLNSNDILLRPANYPSECPGKGYIIIDVNNVQIAVLNLQGRGFMRDHIDCPFRKAESLLFFLQTKTKIIFVDFHAETTAEKQALGHYLDGKISGFYGTHTHVQTADERILPEGTGFITDIGFSGAVNSIIGMEQDIIIKKFITQMPSRFKIEKKPPYELNAIYTEISVDTGKTVKIERIKIFDDKAIL